jgi:hypothetical protein
LFLLLEIYYDAQPHERQICFYTVGKILCVYSVIILWRFPASVTRVNGLSLVCTNFSDEHIFLDYQARDCRMLLREVGTLTHSIRQTIMNKIIYCGKFNLMSPFLVLSQNCKKQLLTLLCLSISVCAYASPSVCLSVYLST